MKWSLSGSLLYVRGLNRSNTIIVLFFVNQILQEIDVARGPVDQQDAIHSGSIVP